MRDEAIGLDMPNGLSREIKYEQKFVRPSHETMPKHPSNHAAKRCPTPAEVYKGIYRE